MLFVVRLGMAFQFQSVAAVAPLLGTNFGVNLADIGLMAVIAAWCGHSTGLLRRGHTPLDDDT